MTRTINSTIIGLLQYGIAGILIALAASAASAEQIDLLLPTESRRSAEVAPGTHPARFNAAALSLALGDEARLTLGGTAHIVVFDRRERHPNGDTTWVGHLKDHGDDYRVIVTHGPAGSFGRILTPDGEFLLHTGPEGGLLIDRQRAGVEDLPTCGGLVQPTGGPAFAQAPRATQKSAPTVIEVEGNLDIDLLIVYTPGMAKNYPGDALQTRLNHLVSLANQAYLDSKVGITLRLVHSAQVEYSDTVSNHVALKDLKYAYMGKIKNVDEWRKQYGADLVSLIRPYNKASGQSCGVAAGVGSYYESEFVGNHVSVVSDRLDTDGNAHGCSDYALAHEIGHNMGSEHDRANADVYLDENGIIVHSGELGQGAFPYSYGYGKKGAFGTIMSYISPGIGKFSNPAISCNGEPCGVAEGDPEAANNALSLNQTRFWVAGYMPTGGTRSAFVDNRDGTATHTNTGLTWMRCRMGDYQWDGKTCAFDYSRAHSGLYTWRQALGLTANFAGHTDWRLPSITELLSIADWRRFDRWRIEDDVLSPPYSKWGSGYGHTRYWSTAPAPSGSVAPVSAYDRGLDISTPLAWVMNFEYATPSRGGQNGEGWYGKSSVRLVRGAQRSDGGKFIDNGDGTVTYTGTNLTWKRCVEGQTWSGTACTGERKYMRWIQAHNSDAKYAGNGDWRLPDMSELLTLIDYTKPIPSLDTTVFPDIVSGKLLWSNTRSGLRATLLDVSPDLIDEPTRYKSITEQHFALLVRGTKTPPQADATGNDAMQTSAIDINRLFNWAETKYADLFKPAMAATQTLSGYTYRSYSATSADLAVKDGRVYYRGSLTGGQIADVGAMADFLGQATKDGF